MSKNAVTLMAGTPNAKTFYLENPSKPTANDINKIKKAYGIPAEFSLNANKRKTQNKLNKWRKPPFCPTFLLKKAPNNITANSQKRLPMQLQEKNSSKIR